MNILHAGDIHLGALRRVTKISFEAKLQRYRGILKFLFETSRTKKVSALVLAGDIFDTKDPFPKVRDLLLQALLHYDDIPTVIIPGNHDQIETEYTTLRFLRLLQDRGKLQHVLFAENAPRIADFNGIWFVLIPPVLDTKEYRQTYKKAVSEVPITNQPIVVVSHESVIGTSDDTGYKVTRGVNIPKLRRVTYVALGDIHRTQAVPGMLNAWYPGPPAQVKFNEHPKKGALLVNLDDPTHPKLITNRYSQVKSLLTVDVDTQDEFLQAIKGSDNAWVSLKTGNIETLRGISANVVKVTPHKNDKSTSVDTSTPLVGLIQWLENRSGLSAKEAEEADSLIRTLMG